MKMPQLNEKQLAAAERTLSFGTWAITFGAILFSVLTVTPLVRSVTPAGWDWTAPILPLVVDAAVVIVIRLDAAVARLGGDAGRWPAILRWLTGLMTIVLNIGHSALNGDMVGVGVHVVAPALLIATGEAGLAYRRAIATALDRIEREHREEAERERSERAAREHRERAEREQQRDAEERREREAREHAARLEREAREADAQQLRDQREHELRVERERAERQAAQRAEERAVRERHEQQEREERQRREQQVRVERERRERAAREQAERAEREHPKPRPVNTPKPKAVNTRKAAPVNTDKMPEADARRAVADHAEMSLRQLVDLTGWSLGWVTARRNEGNDDVEVAA